MKITFAFYDDVHEALNEIAGKKFSADIPDDMREFINARGFKVT